MILLDTNVVSELMRPHPDSAVETWIAGNPVETLYFSAVGEAELRYGAAVMPPGKRRDRLASDIENVMRAAFGDRILPFDSAAARVYAEIVAARRQAGRTVSMADGQIAAIAYARGMAVATRNVRHFRGMGIDPIDPWADG